jgi:hypothetical protein
MHPPSQKKSAPSIFYHIDLNKRGDGSFFRVSSLIWIRKTLNTERNYPYDSILVMSLRILE